MFIYFTKRCFSSGLITVGSRVLSAVLFASPLYAISAELPATSGTREQNLQNQIRLKEQIDRSIEEHRQKLEMEAAPKPAPLADDSPSEAGAKFMINRIDVDAGEFPRLAVDVSDILATYQGRRLGQYELFGLIRDVTNRYASHGYSTTTIGLNPSNMRQGAITLRVDWGKVQGWKVNGHVPETLREHLTTSLTLLDVVDKPLNIFDLDQAIENLNNGAKRATIEVVPSEKLGYSFLNIHTSPSSAPTASLGMDNSGAHSASEGRNRYTFSSSISDVWLGNDTLTANASTRHYRDDQHNSEYSLGGGYSLPFGYNRLDLRYSDVSNSSRVAGYYGHYDLDGDLKTYAAKISKVMWRNGASKFSLFSELERRESENYIERTYLAANSKRYNSLTFGAVSIMALWGGSLYSDVSLAHGLSAFGGAPAAFDDTKPINYKKIAFNTAWSRRFNVCNQNFEYAMRIGGQYAKDSMVSSFKQSIGDEYTVRGFNGPALWGDRALFTNNTLSMPIEGSLGKITPFVGLDAGYVNEVVSPPNTPASSTIAGVAIGARASWNKFDLGVTLARPLWMPEKIESTTSPYITYISVGFSI
ncbi:ShlB/FhaC/HecB family hemolysin secretion/activation protein [Pseudomonas sp. ITA]|uniref:ShlB/FhaC/HecB family hemolysin secretion/activation protein n=1 Tax=Pseudomonas sp. ITA TaxID=2825841 RepID=UPI002496946F|nr:ShlB/FhaC/HecB family hemolysin secretion/activation protein [Pseudomonas sp. ITA]MDI2145855.1 ShlB/FhaC/HecB family hemolysin secretion/activation protein [Pseudomonas sp. ITA]